MVLLGGYKPFYQLLLSESAEEVCDFEGERGPLSAWGFSAGEQSLCGWFGSS